MNNFEICVIFRKKEYMSSSRKNTKKLGGANLCDLEVPLFG
jgi:hypothetical protein